LSAPRRGGGASPPARGEGQARTGRWCAAWHPGSYPADATVGEHAFESERPPRQRYPPYPPGRAWQRPRPLPVQPHQRRAAMPPRALATTSKQACTSAAPAAPVRVLPHDLVVSWSATHKRFLRWTSDGTWDRALAELHHPGPLCPRPQPGALSRSDRLLLNQNVTRSWSSRQMG